MIVLTVLVSLLFFSLYNYCSVENSEKKVLMEKEICRRHLSREGIGCVWMFVNNMFDFRHGGSIHKLLMDKKRGSKRIIGLSFYFLFFWDIIKKMCLKLKKKRILTLLVNVTMQVLRLRWRSSLPVTVTLRSWI